jgi:hypothetical protein
MAVRWRIAARSSRIAGSFIDPKIVKIKSNNERKYCESSSNEA